MEQYGTVIVERFRHLLRLPGLVPGVVLLSRQDCGLCIEAEQVVKRVFGDERVTVQNISGNTALEDEYVFRIPVLLYRDTVVAEGHIGITEARDGLRQARAIERNRMSLK